MQTYKTIQECLLAYDPESNYWIRPINWRGTPQGICVKHGQFYTVPTCKGGHPSYMPTKEELLGSWDIFDCYFDNGDE